MEKTLNQYEVMFVLHPAEDQLQTIKESIQSIIAEHKGQITREEDLGVRDLAYKIKNQSKGFYYLIDMEMDAAEVKGFNRTVRLTEPILKHLLIRR